MSKLMVAVGIFFGLIVGIGVTELYWINQDFTPGHSYPVDCLKESEPKFDRNQLYRVFLGTISTYRLCGLTVGEDYFVTSEGGYNVSITAELQAEIIIIQISEDIGSDGLVELELRNATGVLDTLIVTVTEDSGLPPELFLIVGLPMALVMVTAFFLYRLWRFIKWVRRPIQ